MFYSFASAILWATTGIFIKLLHTIPLFQLMWFRFFLAFIFSLGVFVLGRRYISLRELWTWKELALASLMTVYYIFATTAFSLAPVSLVVLVIAATPVIAFVLQYFKFKVFSIHQFVGFVITLVGIAFYIRVQKGNGNLSFTLATILGASCALAAAFVRALYASLVWQRTVNKQSDTSDVKREQTREAKPMQEEKLSGNVDAFALNVNTMLLGAIICVPTLFVNFSWVSFQQDLSFSFVLLALGLAAIATVLPTVFNTLASTRVDPVLHNIICMSTPILAGLFAWILLDEKQSFWSIVAAMLMVSGIVVSIKLAPKSVLAREKRR